MIREVFALFDLAKVEIKKEHQLLMVSETTSFKKGEGLLDSGVSGEPDYIHRPDY